MVNTYGQQHHGSNSGKISGRVVDAVSGEGLEGATITATQDSTGIFVAYAVSNRKGAFTLSDLPLNHVVSIVVTFTGYRDKWVAMQIVDGQRQTGDWKLVRASQELDSVIVTGTVPPFVRRNDTLEFNADAFRSMPNDVVKDLLLKLPGVRVDESGTIYVYGKKVDKILLDGKAFFGNNLTTATGHLPGDMIDKVQVTDTRDNTTRFNSVVQPLSAMVTLNLTLKKVNQQKVFVHVNATAAIADRYQGEAFINKFNNASRLSILGSVGNLPSQSTGDGGSPGNVKHNRDLSANYNNALGRKGNYAITYRFQDNSSTALRTTERVNLLPGNSFLYSSTSQTDLQSSQHDLQGKWELVPDSLQQLEGTVSATLTNNSNVLVTNASSNTPAGQSIHSQQSLQEKTSRPFLFYQNMLHYHRFSRDGNTVLSANWSFGGSSNQVEQINLARNYFSAGEADSIHQRGVMAAKQLNQNFSVSLNRSLGKNFVAILHYNFDNGRQDNGRRMFRFNPLVGKYDQLDTLYSSDLQTKSVSNQATATLGYRRGKLAAELSAVMLSLRQNNRIVGNASLADTRQKSISPNAAFSYLFSQLVQVVGNYSISFTRPLADQLNPVRDVANPLVVIRGNPLLRTGIAHHYNINFNFYSTNMQWHASTVFSGSFVNDQIVEDAQYDSVGRQLITFRNVEGNGNVGVAMNAGVQMPLNNYTVTVEMSAAAGRDVAAGFINGQSILSNTTTISPSLNIQVAYAQLLNVSTNFGYDVNHTLYSGSDFSSINFHRKHLLMTATVQPIKKVKVTTSVFHSYNSQLTDHFRRAKTFINAAITANLLRSQRLTVGVMINDLLNNNVDTRRTVTPSAIETIQTTSLKRYAGISLRYRINDLR